jgi:cell division protein FtsW
VPIRQRFDRLLLGAAILQTAVGLAILASASWVLASERYGRPGSYFFTWQAATAVVGLGLLVVAMHLRAELLADSRLAIAGLAMTWLMLAIAFVLPPVANTHRWLSVGGISVQPSVLARLALIVFAAVQLDRARRDGWSRRRMLKLGGAGVLTAVLVGAAPDLGSATLIVVVLAAMAFAAGVPLRLLGVPAGLSLMALVVAVVASPYRLERVRAFLESGFDSAASWQSYQSLVALGSGGLLGRGYGAGMQKLFFLPEPHTDFIFSITGEELGLWGVSILMGLATVIVWRGLGIAVRLGRPRGALLAFGLTIGFAVQSLVHMVVCLDLLPPKGIPLPLVSYGKTDLLVTLMSIGILLNLSREVAR